MSNKKAECKFCIDLPSEMCKRQQPDRTGWLCTRKRGHKGQCVACGHLSHDIARWDKHKEGEVVELTDYFRYKKCLILTKEKEKPQPDARDYAQEINALTVYRLLQKGFSLAHTVEIMGIITAATMEVICPKISTDNLEAHLQTFFDSASKESSE